MDEEKKYERYQRQMQLKELGAEGQFKLLSAKVLVIGAGGLGCPALQYLAAAGIGQIGIVDFDVIELSNLHRQILYTMEDVGKSKAETAAKRIKALNPDLKVEVFNERLENSNAFRIISPYDLVLDGSDNFATRYLVNDACALLDKPLVYGAVLKFEGQVGVFNLADMHGIKTSYRDLFPVPPDNAASCNHAGVLGVLPGIIGTMQATEVIKIITGIGEPLCNKIAAYNALQHSLYTIEISRNENAYSYGPKTAEAFLKFNYEWFCNDLSAGLEITAEELNTFEGEKIQLVDLREISELPLIARKDCIKMPMRIFESSLHTLHTKGKIVLICQSGKRSMAALQILKQHFPECEAYSLKGGVEAWQKVSKISV